MCKMSKIIRKEDLIMNMSPNLCEDGYGNPVNFDYDGDLVYDGDIVITVPGCIQFNSIHCSGDLTIVGNSATSKITVQDSIIVKGEIVCGGIAAEEFITCKSLKARDVTVGEMLIAKDNIEVNGEIRTEFAIVSGGDIRCESCICCGYIRAVGDFECKGSCESYEEAEPIDLKQRIQKEPWRIKVGGKLVL